MERIKYKVNSIGRGERESDINLSFGSEGVLIDSSRINDSNLRNLLPGRSVIIESYMNRVVAIYVPGNTTPIYESPPN